MFIKTFAASAVLMGALASGAAAQSVKFADTGSEGLEELQREFGAFRDVLAEVTGLDIEFFAVSNRTVAAEALRAERLDFALAGPSEYTIITSVTDAEPVVAFSRVDYYSVITTLASSGIKAPADLVGKRVAMNDVGSTSGHLGPSQVLADYGLNPVEDVEVMNVPGEVGFQALLRGDVVAMGTSGASYARLRSEASGDFGPGDFRVIARGPDMPNDVLLVGAHVDQDIVDRMRAAFEDPESAERLHAALFSVSDEKYGLTRFIPTVTDADYDYMRNAFRAIGQPQFAERVRSN